MLLFFGQIRRCHKPGGVSLHLFSVSEVVYEGHAHMPIMVAFARLGFKRKYYDEVAFRSWTNSRSSRESIPKLSGQSRTTNRRVRYQAFGVSGGLGGGLFI
jgi:hypothetical protein